MAYPSPVGVTSKAFTGGTITIGFADLPAGTAIGDSILVCFFTDGGSSSTQSTPSGCTSVEDDGSTNVRAVKIQLDALLAALETP